MTCDLTSISYGRRAHFTHLGSHELHRGYLYDMTHEQNQSCSWLGNKVILSVQFQDDAAGENEDEVGDLIGLAPCLDNSASSASDIDFPQGFTFRPRPSI